MVGEVRFPDGGGRLRGGARQHLEISVPCGTTGRRDLFDSLRADDNPGGLFVDDSGVRYRQTRSQKRDRRLRCPEKGLGRRGRDRLHSFVFDRFVLLRNRRLDHQIRGRIFRRRQFRGGRRLFGGVFVVYGRNVAADSMPCRLYGGVSDNHTFGSSER